jgi:HNH endonuclease
MAYGPVPIPVEDRLWPHVTELENGCWLWTRSLRHGYGQIRDRGRVRPVHVVAYELVIGLVPKGLILDHTCRNTACCNPAHLEPVTNLENIRRGIKGALTTNCPQGHPYDALNTYVYRRARYCRICRGATSLLTS